MVMYHQPDPDWTWMGDMFVDDELEDINEMHEELDRDCD